MKRFKLCAILIASLTSLVIATGKDAHAAATNWRTIAPGLSYTTINHDPTNSTSAIHAFQIDLKKYELDIVLAKDFKEQSASIRELAQRSNATIAINGGFFSPEYVPLGLRIQNGKLLSNIKGTSWWGIFAIRYNRPHIFAQANYKVMPQTTMAVQSGPRLVINNTIPPLKGGLAERSALGITEDGKIVIAATQQASMSTKAFAEYLDKPLAQGGLNCRDALNLDGGRSTQLYAQIGQFRVHIPNLSNLTDAVIVRPRRK